MPTYEWRWIEHEPGYGQEFEVDGKIVPGTTRQADPHSTGFQALVKKPTELESVTYEVDSEGVEESPSSPECGVNGCSRTVDSPEDTCWQHE